MRVRKAEREALIELLDQDWEDVSDLADAVFTQAAELFLQREQYILWVGADPRKPMAYGPFVSRNAALKAIGHPVMGYHKSCQAGVTRMLTAYDGEPCPYEDYLPADSGHTP